MRSERRNRRRYEVCLDVSWDSIHGQASARVTDLSASGCYVDSIAEANEGEILELRVRLAGEEFLVLKGEVVHAFSGMGFGFRFENLSSEQRDVLHELLVRLRASAEPAKDYGFV